MNVLGEIVERTRLELDARRRAVPLSALERRLEQAAATRDFRSAISRPGRVNVIAECKKRSPSKGLLRSDYEPSSIAAAYEAAGAAAISVLTEPWFFDGSPAHLSAVREATSLPVLRKDFVIDEYQVVESRALGADAVLLIAAALGTELPRLVDVSRVLGLEPLVEVRDERELERAVEAGAAVIGVNNRNLATLDVDFEAAERLISLVPPGVVAVAESGIRSGDDIRRFVALGFGACLVGESLVTAPDPGRALAEMLHVAEGMRRDD